MNRTRTAHRRLKPCLQSQAAPVSPTYSPRETVSVPVSLAGTRFGLLAGRSGVSAAWQGQNAFERVALGVHTNRTQGERMTAHERTELWAVRSEIRKRAVTDPVEVAHHVMALEAEVLALRQQLESLESEDAPCNCPCCTGACTQPEIKPFRQRTALDA